MLSCLQRRFVYLPLFYCKCSKNVLCKSLAAALWFSFLARSDASLNLVLFTIKSPHSTRPPVTLLLKWECGHQLS